MKIKEIVITYENDLISLKILNPRSHKVTNVD